MEPMPLSPGSDSLGGDVGAALLSTTPLAEVVANASASSVGDRAPAYLEGETEQPKFTAEDWRKWWRDQKWKWSERDEGHWWHDDGKQWREGSGWHDWSEGRWWHDDGKQWREPSSYSASSAVPPARTKRTWEAEDDGSEDGRAPSHKRRSEGLRPLQKDM